MPCPLQLTSDRGTLCALVSVLTADHVLAKLSTLGCRGKQFSPVRLHRTQHTGRGSQRGQERLKSVINLYGRVSDGCFENVVVNALGTHSSMRLVLHRLCMISFAKKQEANAENL